VGTARAEGEALSRARRRFFRAGAKPERGAGGRAPAAAEQNKTGASGHWCALAPDVTVATQNDVSPDAQSRGFLTQIS